MNPLEIFDILLSILDQHDNYKDIITLELLSNQHKINIQDHNWFIQINITDHHLLDKYKFRNIILDPEFKVDNYIDKLQLCHTLDISRTNTTDASATILGKCHTLDISGTEMTDIGIMKLKKCHSLRFHKEIIITKNNAQKAFVFTTEVTDKSAKKLKNCHTLDFTSIREITDETVKELGNCYSLILEDCIYVTDKGINQLTKCHTLNLNYLRKITDKSVGMLTNCHNLRIISCGNITNNSICKLVNCHSLVINCCNISYDGVKNLSNLRELYALSTNIWKSEAGKLEKKGCKTFVDDDMLLTIHFSSSEDDSYNQD